MSKTVIGIDLGTTNSEVAVVREDGSIELVEDGGTPIMPSCVGLAADGRLVVGAEARNQYVLRPEHTLRSVKRKMGTQESLPLGDQTFSPTEISSMIVRELKARAERALGRPVDGAVITVPAYFSDAQRQATRDAGVLAGLEVERILNEPTAAALAYEAAGVDQAKTVLVFDLGGGTFDASVVRMEKDLVEVLGSHGDTQLGGDDVDAMLFDHALELLQREDPEHALSPVGANRLRLALEGLKMRLSDAASAVLAENALATLEGVDASLEWDLDRRTFEEWTTPLLSGTLHSVRSVLKETGLSVAELDEVLLVGGATRMPIVAELLEAEMHRRPRCDLHPDLAVAYGAGVMAARIMGSQQHRILVDVTPYTFGTSCLGELNGEIVRHQFVPIIRAGTPIPARKGQVFYTMYPGQDAVEVRIFQGENPDARQNVFIGNFMVEDLDAEAADNSEILLNMGLDLDGILHVTAVERHTGLSKTVSMENASVERDEEALRASRLRIAELFGDEDGEAKDMESVLKALEAAALEPDEEDEDTQIEGSGELLRRVEAALPSLDEVDAADMARAREAYEQALEAGDETAAERALQEIEDILFYVESK